MQNFKNNSVLLSRILPIKDNMAYPVVQSAIVIIVNFGMPTLSDNKATDPDPAISAPPIAI